jgi:hypothetical protein
MIACLWPHFERAFLDRVSPTVVYEPNDVYELAILVTMFIYNGWLGDVDRQAALAHAFALATQTDPIESPVLMNAVLNIVVVETIVGANDVGAVVCQGDFLALCVKLVRSGGLFGEHNWIMVNRWIPALPQNEMVAEFARAVSESVDLKRNKNLKGQIEPRLRDIVGWRRGEWTEPEDSGSV